MRWVAFVPGVLLPVLLWVFMRRDQRRSLNVRSSQFATSITFRRLALFMLAGAVLAAGVGMWAFAFGYGASAVFYAYLSRRFHRRAVTYPLTQRSIL